MNISKKGLNKIIQEEIEEIFGRKKKAVKEYPASELATLVKGIDDASRLSGADLTRSLRTAIVKELTDVLEGQGFVVKENDRLITGEDDVIVTHQNAPKLKVFLDSIAQLNPKMFKRLVKLFNRSALDISKLVKDIIPSITTVATVDDEEDLKQSGDAIMKSLGKDRSAGPGSSASVKQSGDAIMKSLGKSKPRLDHPGKIVPQEDLSKFAKAAHLDRYPGGARVLKQIAAILKKNGFSIKE